MSRIVKTEPIEPYVAKLRGLLAAAVLDARRLPLTVVLEDGANPEGGYSWNLGDCHDMFVCGNMSRNEAEAIAAAVNALPALLDELEALRAERDGWRTDLTNVVVAWRTATGCDTPTEAGDLLGAYRASDAVMLPGEGK